MTAQEVHADPAFNDVCSDSGSGDTSRRPSRTASHSRSRPSTFEAQHTQPESFDIARASVTTEHAWSSWIPAQQRKITIPARRYKLLTGAGLLGMFLLVIDVVLLLWCLAFGLFGDEDSNTMDSSTRGLSEPESSYWWEWCTEVKSPCDKAFNKHKAFCDSNLTFEARARDIVSRISLEHYPWLLSHDERANFTTGAYCSATTLPVDGIPGMNWGTEGLHGLAISAGNTFKRGVTSFPNVITTASSWSRENFRDVGKAIGEESRALWNEGQLSHLAMWTPNINIVRDPRWGRAQETPGEDPYLTSEYAIHFVNGMQQVLQEGSFVQAEACLKHYLAYNFENSTANNVDRMFFSAQVDEFDLQHTYLPMFERTVKHSSVGCVMCSYNAVNGVPSCANKKLLKDKLVKEWGFGGYVVTDCGAVRGVEVAHRYTGSFEETVRAVLEAGVNLECDSYFSDHADEFVSLLRSRGNEDLLALAEESLVKLFMARLRLGIFESGERKPFRNVASEPVTVPGPWNSWSHELNGHQRLALKVATEGMVLLKNSIVGGRRALPLNIASSETGKARKISFIGPLIDSLDAIQGNYRGPIPYGLDDVTFYWGFQAVLEDLQRKLKLPPVEQAELRRLLIHDSDMSLSELVVDVELRKNVGCEGATYNRYGCQTVYTTSSNVRCDDHTHMKEATALAAESDDVVLVVGMDPTWEGEQPIGDRLDILLPAGQVKLIENILSGIEGSTTRDTRVHLVVVGGAALDLSRYEADSRVSSIVWAGYPSQAGGRALANLFIGADPLTGQPVSFSGRLTTTWYSQAYFSEFVNPNRSSLDMRMRKTDTSPGRGYRYYSGPNVVYHFGHGLTYMPFEVIVQPAQGSRQDIAIKNLGEREAGYVLLLYGPGAGTQKQLCNFFREVVKAKSTAIVTAACDEGLTEAGISPAFVQMPDGTLKKL